MDFDDLPEGEIETNCLARVPYGWCRSGASIPYSLIRSGTSSWRTVMVSPVGDTDDFAVERRLGAGQGGDRQREHQTVDHR